MRKILYQMLVSLDGYIEAPGADLGWAMPNEELHRHFNELERALDLELYGRGMYETMSAFWPTADEDPSAPEVIKDFARIWRAKPKVVFSTTLQKVDWNSRLVSSGLAEEVRKLKAQPGKEMSVSGAGLAASLMKLDLIDEYSLYVHPVLLGAGTRMFGPLPRQIQLELLETRTFGDGVTMLRYGVKGDRGAGG